MWQKIADAPLLQACCAESWMMFAVKNSSPIEEWMNSCLWHTFCMFGLRPSNLRVGCREIVRIVSMFCIKGA